MNNCFERSAFLLIACVLGCADSGPVADGGDGNSEVVDEEAAPTLTEEGPCAGARDCAWLDGRVIIRGEWQEWDEMRPFVEVSHCSESYENQVRTSIFFPDPSSDSGRGALILRILGYPKYTRIGESRALDSESSKVSWRASAWLSNAEAAPRQQRPVSGEVRFDALGEGESLALVFELDFGELGGIRGEVRASNTTEQVCDLSGGTDLPVAPIPR